ncbi:MAG: hypothetical protein ABIG37_03315 [Nanoarchaeota archaeon]
MSESYIQELVKYIKKNLSKGYTIESLRFALLNQGYGVSGVNRAIRIANEELAKQIPEFKEKPLIKIEREPVSYDFVLEEKQGSFLELKRFFRKLCQKC